MSNIVSLDSSERETLTIQLVFVEIVSFPSSMRECYGFASGIHVLTQVFGAYHVSPDDGSAKGWKCPSKSLGEVDKWKIQCFAFDVIPVGSKGIRDDHVKRKGTGKERTSRQGILGMEP